MNTNQKKFDLIITDFIRKNLLLFFIVGISILTLVIRNEFRGWLSGDMIQHLVPWAEYLEAHGGFAGIASGPPYCDYPVTYQYMLAFLTYLPGSYLAKLKVVSVFFDFVNAGLAMLIVRQAGAYSKKSFIPWLAYAAYAPLHSVSVWSQSLCTASLDRNLADYGPRPFHIESASMCALVQMDLLGFGPRASALQRRRSTS